MIKVLVDDFGRIIGACDVPRSTIGRHEYGWRDEDGMLHVTGTGIVKPCSSTIWRNAGVNHDERIVMMIQKSTALSYEFKLFDVA